MARGVFFSHAPGRAASRLELPSPFPGAHATRVNWLTWSLLPAVFAAATAILALK
ncbi:MAG: hypothetical protein Q8N18_14020 [Opitutaceae bacterium]|nr:hypothetical protein [Opitutaceae bacterium]